MITKY